MHEGLYEIPCEVCGKRIANLEINGVLICDDCIGDNDEDNDQN